MIPRYSRPEMAAIFAPETRLGIWLDVELAAAEAMAAIGAIPAEPVRTLAATVAASRERLIDPARVEEIEAATRHDVIAFLTHVEEVCGEEARFLHLGLTSSDLLDTTLAIQLERAADLILADLDARARRAGAARASSTSCTPTHRPQPRHPRRAHHLRPQARRASSPSSAATAGAWCQARTRS